MAQENALLVIDMQVALTERAYARDEVVAAIQTLVAGARAAGAPAVYIQHESNLTLVADGHTTWDGALPAAQIIAHHNAVIAGLPFPGRQIDVVPAAAVRWGRP